MLFSDVLTHLTLVATVSAVAVSHRSGTCTLEFGFARGQNPISGGDNSLACHSTVTYADGSQEGLTDECRYVMNDHCYTSKLPYTMCTHANFNLKDGYLNYADQHVDFHDDGCKTDSYAQPVTALPRLAAFLVDMLLCIHEQNVSTDANGGLRANLSE